MQFQKTVPVNRSVRALGCAAATVLLSIASSFSSTAHAVDLKSYSPAQCRAYGGFSSEGVYYYHNSVQNYSPNYTWIVCPTVMDSESASPMAVTNPYFKKATASPAFFCYVFSSSLSNTSSRWVYNSNSTTVGIGALYNTGIPTFRYGSNAMVCGLPPSSELLNYYTSES
jgi:hypothetical protein